MADLSKLIKKPGRRAELGAPPTLDEASENLAAPEVAPATKRARGAAVAPTRSKPPTTASGRIDGRSARKTHRTVQFATRVTPEWDERIRALAQREGLLLVELLEKLLDHYDRSKSKS